MSKASRERKKSSLLNKIRDFFFPKNFRAEVKRGMYMSSPYGGLGEIFYNLGRRIRRAVDPKHKLKLRKEKVLK